MTNLLDALLSKLEAHRDAPESPGLVREIHALAAESPALVDEALNRLLPLRTATLAALAPPAVAPPLEPAPAATPEWPPPGLPPALPPPLTNWGTNQSLSGAAELRQPVDDGQAKNVLALALRRGLRAKPIGTAHSSSRVMVTRGILVDSGALAQPGTTPVTSTLRQCRELVPGFYRLDEAARALHVEVGAGVQVKDVNAYLAASGRALAMTGAYTGQTLIGAFATSTHGSGIQHPPLHAAARSIQLLTADAAGAVVEMRIEPSHGITDPESYARGYPHVTLVQSDDWFRAVVVAMGTMGFITSVVVEVTTAFSLLNESWKGTWAECRELLRDTDERGYPRYFAGTYAASVSCNPYAVPLSAQGRQTATISRTFAREAPPPQFTPPSQGGLSPLLVLAGRLVGNDLPALTPFVIDLALGGDPGAPTWGPSFALLGSPDNLPPGFSSEYAFPLDRALGAVDAMLLRMARLADEEVKYLVGPITLRWVAKDTAFLSMSEGDDRVYAEFLSLAHAGAGQEVLAEIEGIALDHGGRPHWGQWFSLDAVPRIAAMYPKYPPWRERARQLDVSGLFANELTERLP